MFDAKRIYTCDSESLISKILAREVSAKKETEIHAYRSLLRLRATLNFSAGTKHDDGRSSLVHVSDALNPSDELGKRSRGEKIQKIMSGWYTWKKVGDKKSGKENFWRERIREDPID